MSRGKLEEKINLETAKIYKEMLGKGPERVSTTFCEDFIIIRVVGASTIIFNHLSSTDKGQEVLKSMRRRLFELFEGEAKKRYEKVVNKKVKEIFYNYLKSERQIILTIML